LATDREPAGDGPERGDLEDEESREESSDEHGAAREQPEVDRHADRDEEESQQQPLEGLDVALEEVPEFGVREQYAGDESGEAERKAARGHELRNADQEEQREAGEELAQVGARDEAQQRRGEVTADHDDARDRGRGDRETLPQRRRTGALDVPDEGHERDER